MDCPFLFLSLFSFSISSLALALSLYRPIYKTFRCKVEENPKSKKRKARVVERGRFDLVGIMISPVCLSVVFQNAQKTPSKE